MNDQPPRLSAPVLFLIFNRPAVTRRVFAEIRSAQPARLYIAGDGPRPGKAGEAEKVAQTRNLVLEGIDWPCEVKTLFRETNLGCRNAVSSAVDWFFENEAMGIILEDDCLPEQSFFPFCRELLERYRDDKRIMAVSGDNFQHGIQRGNFSYYFSQISHCWGWASWRRAWQLNETAIDHFEEITTNPGNLHFTHNPTANKMWLNVFIKTHRRQIDSWAYLWTFANFVNHGLTILPNVNLVQNIGFGADATHTTGSGEAHVMDTENIAFPLAHPPYVIYDRQADDFTYKTHFGLMPLTQKIRIELSKKLNLWNKR